MDLLPLVGRALFALTFLGSGIGHFKHTELLARQARGSGLPAPQLAVQVSGSVLIVGGALVLAGWHARAGAALIGLFLLAVSLSVHRFWTIEETTEAALEQAHFMKNMGLLGAAFLIMYFGPGPYSLGS